ncbi:MAG: hypothetical protein ACFCU4_03365 [Puniceicoccaceae bacterium]
MTHENKQGAALPIALLIAALILVVSLSISSLLRTDLQTAGNKVAKVLDQQNAIFALQIAIGDLQKSSGIDQAVTANAELLRADNTASAYKKKWLGVWSNNSSDFDSLNPVPQFETWLVSGGSLQSLSKDREKVFDTFLVEPAADGTLGNTTNQVHMVGLTSVVDPADQVFVPRVSFSQDGRNSSYAYWVSDESQKILLNLPDEDEDIALTSVRRRSRVSAPASPSFEDLTSLGPALTALNAEDQAKRSRLTFLNDTGLLSTATLLGMRKSFHDLSLNNLGLFTNPVQGGLKKDLSYVFEMSEASFRASEFGRDLKAQPLEYVTDNSGASAPTKPIFNFRPQKADGTLPDGMEEDSIFRGPTFDLLRDHYRLHHKVKDPFSQPVAKAQGYFPNAYFNRNVDQFNRYITAPELHSAMFESSAYNTEAATRNEAKFAPAVSDLVSTRANNYGGAGKPRPRFTNTEVAPEIVRILLMASIRLENIRPNSDPTNFPTALREGDLTLILEPIVYVHNPYNVALEFDALRAFMFRIDFGLTAFTMESTGWPFYSRHQGSNANLSSYIRKEAIGNGTLADLSGPNRDAALALDLVVTRAGLPANDPITLLPGEIKAFTANANSTTSIGDDYRVVLEENVNAYSFSGGLTMIFLEGNETASSVKPFVVRDSTWLGYVFDFNGGSVGNRGTTPVPGRGRMPEYGAILTYLLSREDTQALPSRTSTESPGLRHLMLYPQNFLSGMAGHTADGDVSFKLPALSFDHLLNDRHYVGFIDFYMKPTLGEHYQTSLFQHHATRAIALNPELNGAIGKNGARIAPTWGMSVANEIEANGGEPPSARLGFGSSGKSYWGTGLTVADGQPKVILYDVPTRPLTSLGEFQHLNQQIHVWEPAFAIGNSRASPYIPRDRIWQVASNKDLVHPQFDVSYLSNQALWDQYFFSSISKPYGLDEYLVGLTMREAISLWDASPLNPRIRPVGRHQLSERLDALDEIAYGAEQTRPDEGLPHNRVAEFYGMAGMFNVNSISVEAWKAILGSLNQSDVEIVSDSGEVVPLKLGDSLRLFPRGSLQGGGTSSSSADRWNGLASLSAADVDRLAREIVEQIKLRSRSRGAPFASLSHFINRELTNGPFGLAGPLQTAIDQAAFDPDLFTSQGAAIKLDSTDEISAIYTRYTNDPPMIARTKEPQLGRLQPDSVYIDYPEPTHFVKNSAGGIAQDLTQADLLSVIGSQLSVRSDTFVIRAYGNHNNDPQGGVWCEAIVQRVPDYVLPDLDSPQISPDRLQEFPNKKFGRRFEIIGFRWLKKEEL